MLRPASTEDQSISHYKIIKKIGQGGMATVYEAYDRKKKRHVALKVLLPRHAHDAIIRQRFMREARVGMTLDHPGIARVYEVGEGMHPFIAMELIKGKTLGEIIEQGPLPLSRTIDIAYKIADALIAAHKGGIIHRDIKPGNIMIMDDTVKVMDFGLARVVDTTSLTGKHEVIGTLYYMSPEQVIGDAIDARSDVFSLGAVLYQMLTAQRPFDGEHAGTIIHAILYSEPVRICDIDRGMPREVEQIVAKALQKRNYRRYQSILDLRADLLNLGKLLSGKSVHLIASDISTEEVFEDHRGVYSGLIGRENEMEELQRHLTRMLQGRSSVVLLGGEAGVGKSRLAWELGQRARKQDVQYLIGRCTAYGTMPYQPILEVIQKYFEYRGIKTIPALKDFIREHAEHLLHRRDMIAALVIDHHIKDINIINEKQLWDTAAELFKVIARDRPAVIHLDDLHWADAPTLDMFTYILRTLNGTRLLIVGTYRPEDMGTQEHPFRKTLKRIHEEKLGYELSPERLSRKQTRDLINSVFENFTVTEKFADSIYRETEGNPLYVLEVLKLLRDEHIITRSDKGWRIASDAVTIRVPRTVTDVILRRVRKLDQDECKIIGLASVVGSLFTSDTLEHCLERSRVDILRSLQNLESSHNLIHATKAGYRFDHGKIKDVVYNNLIPELRREYHKIVGQYVMKIHADDARYAGEIAHHLAGAALTNHALPYFVKAGEYSRKIFANHDGLRYFSRGLQIAGEKSREDRSQQIEKMKVTMLKGRGQIRCVIGEYAEAISDLEKMISIAETIGDKRDQMFGFAEIGKVLYRRSEYAKAITFQTKALRVCRELDSRQDEPDIALQLAQTLYIKPDTKQALKLLTHELELTKELHDRIHEGEIYGYYAVLNVDRSRYKRAFSYFKRALRKLGEKQYKYKRAFIYNQMAIALRHKTRFDKALFYQKRALKIYEEVGDRMNQVICLNNTGLIHYYLGNYTAAIIYFEKARSIATHIGETRFLAHILNNLALTIRIKGDDKKALEYCGQALAIARRIGDELNEAIIHRTIGWCEYNKGNYASALRHGRRELKYARRRKYKRFESASLHLLTHIYAQRGDLKKGLVCAESAVEIAKQIGIEQGLWFYFTSLIDIYNDLNEVRKASHTLKTAATLIKRSRSRSARGWLYYYLSLDRLRHGLSRSAHTNVVKCRKIAEATGSCDMKISARLVEGKIYFQKKQYPRALKSVRKALKISDGKNRVHKQVESHILMARISLKMGNISDAGIHADRAVTIAARHGMNGLFWEARLILGKAYLAQKAYRRAYQELGRADKILQEIAAGLDDGMRRTYLRKKECRDLSRTMARVAKIMT